MLKNFALGNANEYRMNEKKRYMVKYRKTRNRRVKQVVLRKRLFSSRMATHCFKLDYTNEEKGSIVLPSG